MAGHYTVRIIPPIRILIIFVFGFLVIFLCHVGHRNVINPEKFRHDLRVRLVGEFHPHCIRSGGDFSPFLIITEHNHSTTVFLDAPFISNIYSMMLWGKVFFILRICFRCNCPRGEHGWFGGERSNHTTATQFCPHIGRCCSWHTSGGVVLDPDHLAGLEIRGGDKGHGVFPWTDVIMAPQRGICNPLTH